MFLSRRAAFLAVSVSLTLLSGTDAHASVEGSSCKISGQTLQSGGLPYVCGLNNSGSKMWILNQAKMKIGTNAVQSVALLDAIPWSTGNWSKTSNIEGIRGVVATYKSAYGCQLYRAANSSAAQRIYNLESNYFQYRGYWLYIPAKNWVLNDISDSGNCHQYFAMAWGGYGRQN